MKNKTLTLMLPIILIASFFTACSKTVKEEINSPRVSESKLTEATFADINFEDLDKEISKSVLATKERFKEAELSTEGHLLIEAELKDNMITAYLIAGVSNYGFVNDVFTCVDATGAIPTIITYEVNPDNNRYTEISYLEPEEGMSFEDGIKSIFPEKYVSKALEADMKYPEIEAMQMRQVNEYLKFIERDAQVENYVETAKLQIEMSEEEFNKEYPNYPYFEGAIEVFDEDTDVRYIYKSNHIDEESIACTKEMEDGTVIEKFIIFRDGSLKEE